MNRRTSSSSCLIRPKERETEKDLKSASASAPGGDAREQVRVASGMAVNQRKSVASSSTSSLTSIFARNGANRGSMRSTSLERNRVTPKVPLKEMSKKASTPLNPKSDKSLNVSGVSVISPLKEKQQHQGVTTGAGVKLKSSFDPKARRGLPFAGPEARNDPIKGPMRLLPIGHDQESRAKEVESSALLSSYLQVHYLDVKAGEALRNMEEDASVQIYHFWESNELLAQQLEEKKAREAEMQHMLQVCRLTDSHRSFLEPFLSKQQEVASHLQTLTAEIMRRDRQLRLLGVRCENPLTLRDVLHAVPQLNESAQSTNAKIRVLCEEIISLSGKLQDAVSLASEGDICLPRLEEVLKKKKEYEMLDKKIQDAKG